MAGVQLQRAPEARLRLLPAPLPVERMGAQGVGVGEVRIERKRLVAAAIACGRTSL